MRSDRSPFAIGRGVALAILALCAAISGPAYAEPLKPLPQMKLERVVLLMRHGIRPPTNERVTPPGIADQAWPGWDTQWGYLTAHGAQAIELLARADRAEWARRGLLPAKGCPAKGVVEVYADSDQRTIATGEAVLKGLGADCGLQFGHLKQGETDVLFSPLEHPGVLDKAKALAAVQAEVGDIPALMKAHAAEVELAQRMLGCCSVKVCEDAKLAAGCKLTDIPSSVVMPDKEGRPEATGPLDFLPTAAQSTMLAYVEGKPMKEVGFGRIQPSELKLLMSLHTLKGQVLQRPNYIGAHGATPLAKRMLGALEAPAQGPALTILVGHDTNISDLGGMLGLHWQVSSYPADTPPPGGGMGFELLRDAKGARFVRAFYRSQTMDQMRTLQPLDAGHDADRLAVAIPGCAGADGLCPLADFRRIVTAALTTTP